MLGIYLLGIACTSVLVLIAGLVDYFLYRSKAPQKETYFILLGIIVFSWLGFAWCIYAFYKVLNTKE